nr:MAG TPA: hypothetical protein [Caudoviricetes sp.]
MKKRYIRSTELKNSTLLFTPASLVDFLSQIDELSEKSISLNSDNGYIEVSIGEATYRIRPQDEVNVPVSVDDIDEVNEAADDTYDELVDNGYIENSDEIESGLIKELIKTLAIGGMVRLAAKKLKK